ncbi:PREDICTED: histone H2A.V-like [Elephantulus edwardii]|uniref:histone H2A.V-like n=1 Tax=Elephantulus edwardii TaxID=28737 RepID=UPI0003F0CD7E|nr:PREDICTED: histone H2A.V-like [Elephantulus edwardii]
MAAEGAAGLDLVLAGWVCCWVLLDVLRSGRVDAVQLGNGGTAAKDSGKAKAKAVSPSQRAGFRCPVGRIHRHLKTRITSHGRVGATAATFSAAILKCFTAQVLKPAAIRCITDD